jgi:hypothetical protein
MKMLAPQVLRRALKNTVMVIQVCTSCGASTFGKLCRASTRYNFLDILSICSVHVKKRVSWIVENPSDCDMHLPRSHGARLGGEVGRVSLPCHSSNNYLQVATFNKTTLSPFTYHDEMDSSPTQYNSATDFCAHGASL